MCFKIKISRKEYWLRHWILTSVYTYFYHWEQKICLKCLEMSNNVKNTGLKCATRNLESLYDRESEINKRIFFSLTLSYNPYIRVVLKVFFINFGDRFWGYEITWMKLIQTECEFWKKGKKN